MLNKVGKICKHKKIFERNKRNVETKILGVLLYHRGLSYRDTEKILRVFESCSYEAVHYWYKQFHRLFAVKCKQREKIALDENNVLMEKGFIKEALE